MQKHCVKNKYTLTAKSRRRALSCVSTRQERKEDISNDIKEAIFAAKREGL